MSCKKKLPQSFVLHGEIKEQAEEWVRREEWVDREEYEKDEVYMSCVRDILEHPVFQSMDQFIQHGNTTTKTHCIQVSYLSYCICRKHSMDYRAAARAGLLHDLFLYDWHTEKNHIHGYTHPRVAMNNAVKYFDITPKEQNMILRHMWPLTPVPPKSREGMVIVYADKFCGINEVYGRIKQAVLRAVHA